MHIELLQNVTQEMFLLKELTSLFVYKYLRYGIWCSLNSKTNNSYFDIRYSTAYDVKGCKLEEIILQVILFLLFYPRRDYSRTVFV